MNLSTTTNGSKIKYKFVCLGDQSVGKSSIIQKYINNRFDQSSNPTVGIDFLAKNLAYKSKSFRLQLWDTAGQQRFKSLIPSYLKDAICAIIVYDVTNRASLQNTQKWLKLYHDNRIGDGYSILVGNKIDLSYRTVTCEQGKRLAQHLKIDHFEISAKSSQGVQQLFLHLIDMLLENKTNGTGNLLDGIITQTQDQDKKQQQINIDQIGQNNENLESHITIKTEKQKAIINERQNIVSEVKNQVQKQNIILDSKQMDNKKKKGKKSNCC